MTAPGRVTADLGPAVIGLRRYRAPKPAQRAGERCDLCADPIAEQHPHVVDVESRALLCSCRACYPLFVGAVGRFRAVPERHRRLPSAALAAIDATWEASDVPVGMAFAFRSTATGKPIAFYPSPAGATESLLPSDAWAPLFADEDVGEVESDVEALLVNRTREGLAAYLVPIDACYELVGLVRRTWKGFDGGTEARESIAAFFGRIESRCEGDARG